MKLAEPARVSSVSNRHVNAGRSGLKAAHDHYLSRWRGQNSVSHRFVG